ncbi:MAG: AzlD domain-containing protein [Lachnospiraceae bacterium]
MPYSKLIPVLSVSIVITFSLRALPFIIFLGDRRMPPFLEKLGKILPPAIMAVLVVYCLKQVVTDFGTYGIPQLVATVVVVVSYKWKHNTFLSIGAGTACNMLLLHVL